MRWCSHIWIKRIFMYICLSSSRFTWESNWISLNYFFFSHCKIIECKSDVLSGLFLIKIRRRRCGTIEVNNINNVQEINSCVRRENIDKKKVIRTSKEVSYVWGTKANKIRRNALEKLWNSLIRYEVVPSPPSF